MNKFNKILVPTDFSPGSDSALQYACELAKALESEIHIIHVIEPAVLPSGPGYPVINPVDFGKSLKERAEAEINIIAQSIPNNITRRIVILFGKASDNIIEYANENNIDLICIATHGRKGIEHLLFGSTTEKVLRKANCPVLAVRIIGE